MRRLFRVSIEPGVRRLLLILISIVLLASIFGVYKAFTLPTEIEEEITLVNYEHKGEFDYLAYIEACYLFDDIPLETAEPDEPSPESPPAKPKYPIEMINKIYIFFHYCFVPDKPVWGISEEVEVKARLGGEEVILVPKKTTTEEFTVGFSLDASELDLSSDITITAYVYTTVETHAGPIFESFAQSLAIRSKGPLLEVDRDLTSSQRASFGEWNYEQIGEFDYSVLLKSDSPFGAITLKPPPATLPTPPTPPTVLSSRTLGPGETVFTKLFESMDVSFSYQLESDRPVGQIAEEVEIIAILENPDVWSKTFVLVPPTEKSGPFTVTFPLDTDDFSHFNDVFRAIETETGVSVPHKLIIKADVHTVAQTDFGPIDEEFSQTLTTTLGGDILEWEEELVASKPGAIKTSRMIPNPNKFVGLSISEIRNLSAIVAGVFFILFLYLLVLNVWLKPKKLSRIEEEALRAKKKYKNAIVDIKELPEAKADETVIWLSSLDELVKAADALLKPVLHKAEPERHAYCVIDGLTRYQYVVTGTKEQGSHAGKTELFQT